METPRTITMCPYSWNHPKRKDSLSDWRDGTKALRDGKALDLAMSTPSTLLHELCHMTTALGKLTEACLFPARVICQS